jgi:cell shape-determining protein MreC
LLVVQKGNKQLDINEIQKDVFLALGYSVVNQETGEIQEAGQATTLSDLKTENATLKEKLSEYKEVKVENETLKKQVEDLTAQLEATSKGKSK